MLAVPGTVGAASVERMVDIEEGYGICLLNAQRAMPLI